MNFRKLGYIRRKKKNLRSCFFTKRENAISGVGSSQSAGVIQGHLMLRILLHNFQRPSTLANLTHGDFAEAKVMENGDRVIQV